MYVTIICVINSRVDFSQELQRRNLKQLEMCSIEKLQPYQPKPVAAETVDTNRTRLVVVGELVCLNDPESYTVGGFPPAGLTLADRSKGRGQTKW